MYVSVFIDMERSAQLQSYYSQCHKVTHGHYINHRATLSGTACTIQGFSKGAFTPPENGFAPLSPI